VHLWRRRFQLQKYFLRFCGATIGNENTFNGWVKFEFFPSNVVIGHKNFFSTGVIINCREGIRIGNENHFSSNVVITDQKLNLELKMHEVANVAVGDNNWLSTGVIVASSHEPIFIGNSVIVGAHSFVNKSLLNTKESNPEGKLFFGTPARPQGRKS
jgi:acetyltransferase-like isoleucine patch superfamily enzyme